jgi:endonuclease/exonuclease/phosphatase family metal-dependent hydrolase
VSVDGIRRGDPTRRRLVAPLATALGATSTVCGALLWLVGAFLPFEPPWHTWLLAAGAVLGVAGLALQPTLRWSWTSGTFATLGVILAAVFVGMLLGPVRPSKRGIEPFEISSAPRMPQRLLVLSYNVLHGHPRFLDQEARLATLSNALERLEPDLALFQEAWCTRRHGCLVNRLATGEGPLHGYHLAYTAVNGSLRLIGFEEGLAVASRWPIERVTVHSLRPRERPWRRRAVLVVALRIDGQLWTFATAHLANDDAAAREAQASSLAELLPDSGTLLLGADLNDPAHTATLQPLEARGLVSVLDGARDHFLVRELPGAWRVVDARWLLAPDDPEGGVPVSDHPAAWVELARGAPEM